MGVITPEGENSLACLPAHGLKDYIEATVCDNLSSQFILLTYHFAIIDIVIPWHKTIRDYQFQNYSSQDWCSIIALILCENISLHWDIVNATYSGLCLLLLR